MKRVALGLAVAAAAALFAPQASAEEDFCIKHPRTPYPLICLSPR